MKCPRCGSGEVDVPMVDIGVGEQQCGPAHCLDCHWVEEHEDTGLLLPDDAEFNE